MAVDLPDWQTRAAIGTDTSVASFTLDPGIASAPIDTTGLASVIIGFGGQTIANDAALWIQWLDPAGNVVFTDRFTIIAAPLGTALQDIIARCLTDSVSLVWDGTADLAVTVIGSQRQPQVFQYGGISNFDTFDSASAAMVAGQFYEVGSGYIAGAGGWAQLDFEVSGTTVTGTLFLQLQQGTASQDLLMIADTAEAHTDVNIRLVSKQVIVPAGVFVPQFFCRTSGTAVVVANFGWLPR